jgi:hypothetical protein
MSRIAGSLTKTGRERVYDRAVMSRSRAPVVSVTG